MAGAPVTTKSAETETTVSELQSATGSCGLERWYVKTGMDDDSAQVDMMPKDTTVEAMASLPAPSTLPARSRVGSVERTVWRVHATLTVYKLEEDSDVHMVLTDAGQTMIVEIPDVACIGYPSPFKDAIREVRRDFDRRFPPTTSFESADIAVTVTGVGFFDFLHGQTGVAPNGIELHPVLSIDFGSAAPEQASTTSSAPGDGASCDSSYPDFCIPPPPPDLDCRDLNPQRFSGAHKDFTVRAPDPHHFDSDHDGRGCESGIG